MIETVRGPNQQLPHLYLAVVKPPLPKTTMHIRRINKGGSLLVCKDAPKQGKGLLKGIYRWTGTLYHVPSLRYLLESSDASQDQVDAVTAYFDSLSVGDFIDWDVQTEEPVYYTQDRHGNDLPEPRKSTRLYADIDLEKLESAVAGASAPAAPARRTRSAKP